MPSIPEWAAGMTPSQSCVLCAALLTLQTWNVCGRTFSCILACNLIDVCLVICLRLNYSLSPLNKCFVCFWWVSVLHNFPPSYSTYFDAFISFCCSLSTESWERLLLGEGGEPLELERLCTVIIWLRGMWLLFLRFKLRCNTSSHCS